MLTTYVIPIALNCVATCHMSLALWRAGGPNGRLGDVETEQFRRAERKKKKVGMMVYLMYQIGFGKVA